MTADQPNPNSELRQEADRLHAVYLNHAARNTPLDPHERAKAWGECQRARDAWLATELQCFRNNHPEIGADDEC